MPFALAANRVNSRGARLKSSEYQAAGLYPIVDQGQDLVVGYTDDANALAGHEPPLIVFGDHTKNIKYVDFDFAVGADGVVLLKPHDEIVPKFFYYWMRSLELHDLGYSRHFKLLKEQTISFPTNKAEQHQVVSVIESLTTRAQELTEHTQAIASDMQRAVASFYEQLANEAPQQPLEAVASPVRRPITTTPEGSYPELGLRSFGKGTFHKPALSGTEVGGKRIFRIHAGDLVFSNVFGWEGAIAVAQPEDDGRAGSHRYITYLADPQQSTPEFLCFHFLTARGLEDIRAASPGSAGRNRTLGLERLKQIQVPVPPFEEQRRFAELVKRQREITKHAASITEDLRKFEAALLAKAFRGEL
jgi:restriction endonuclease S subunit